MFNVSEIKIKDNLLWKKGGKLPHFDHDIPFGGAYNTSEGFAWEVKG